MFSLEFITLFFNPLPLIPQDSQIEPIFTSLLIFFSKRNAMDLKGLSKGHDASEDPRGDLCEVGRRKAAALRKQSATFSLPLPPGSSW